MVGIKLNINNSDDVDGLKTMMNKYFVKHIRFPIMNKEYFFKHIELSDILNLETKYQITKSWLVEKHFEKSVQTRKTAVEYSMFKHKYSSPFCWYPRKPYERFFLAKHDIMMLKVGDQVAANLTDCSYGKRRVSTIDKRTKSVFKKGILFNHGTTWCYADMSADTIRKQRYMASPESLAASFDTKLTLPSPMYYINKEMRYSIVRRYQAV